jgi:hypothetical protein
MTVYPQGPPPAMPYLPDDRPRVIPVWVRLDAAFPHPPDAPWTSVPDGWDLAGNVPGTLDPRSWIRSARGMWLAVCSFPITSADGERTRRVARALVPGHALRRRS